MHDELILKHGANPKNVLRRIKDIAERLNDPQELCVYLEKIASNSRELEDFSELFHFEPGLGAKTCLFGHFDELHDRISGKDGSFNEVSGVLKNSSVASIGVTRHNFFCLDEILRYWSEISGRHSGSGFAKFDVFPVGCIVKNFIRYASELKRIAATLGAEFVLCDEELIDILQVVQFHGQRQKISDRDLVRLLGVISEHAFIGPQTIVFDPYHRCNIKCKHCFVHNPVIHHNEEFLQRKLDFGMFKGIIDDAAMLKVDGIILQGDGEPLLHDKFFDMLRYARNNGIGVLFFTNGSLIGEKEAREIIELEVNQVYCSFPAGTAATYKEVTTVNNEEIYHVTVENLRRLMQLKRKLNKEKPRLIMTHVIHNLNCHELIDMAKTDAFIGTDAARFYLIRIDDNNQHLKLSESDLQRIKKDLPAAARIFKENRIDFVDNILFQLDHYDDQTGAWSKDIFLKEGCTIGWYFCLIPALYDVSLCCHLRTTGDLKKMSFRELWESRDYRRYRVKAKFLKENRNFTFSNGVNLYDEHCEHCDNHQTLVSNLENLHNLGLYKFYK